MRKQLLQEAPSRGIIGIVPGQGTFGETFPPATGSHWKKGYRLMMEGSYCEVIGCEEHADRMLQYPSDISAEDYLCTNHWERLQAYKPERADCYASISPLPTEGEKRQTHERYSDRFNGTGPIPYTIRPVLTGSLAAAVFRIGKAIS